MKQKINKYINRLRWKLQKIIHFVRPIRYEKTAWVLGVGRSGTTWISSLINYKNCYIEWFEPFHKFNQKLLSLDYHNFKPLNSNCTKYAEHIFSGKEYYQCWREKFRKQPLFPSKDLLIVKDITMNLSAYRLCSNNVKIKPILLIRNPFAVALSQQSKKWKLGKEFENILDNLYSADLQTIIMGGVIQKIIKNRSEFEEKILIWSILNYVPLKQFRENKILITFYEDWVMNADREMKRVYEYLEMSLTKDNISRSEKYKQPSHTVLSSREKFSIDTWKEKITEKDYQAGMHILKLFGFDNLYDENSLPNRECLNQLYRGFLL